MLLSPALGSTSALLAEGVAGDKPWEHELALLKSKHGVLGGNWAPPRMEQVKAKVHPQPWG